MLVRLLDGCRAMAAGVPLLAGIPSNASCFAHAEPPPSPIQAVTPDIKTSIQKLSAIRNQLEAALEPDAAPEQRAAPAKLLKKWSDEVRSIPSTIRGDPQVQPILEISSVALKDWFFSQNSKLRDFWDAREATRVSYIEYLDLMLALRGSDVKGWREKLVIDGAGACPVAQTPQERISKLVAPLAKNEASDELFLILAPLELAPDVTLDLSDLLTVATDGKVIREKIVFREVLSAGDQLSKCDDKNLNSTLLACNTALKMLCAHGFSRKEASLEIARWCRHQILARQINESESANEAKMQKDLETIAALLEGKKLKIGDAEHPVGSEISTALKQINKIGIHPLVKAIPSRQG